MSGEVQLQFSLVDSASAAASPEEIYKKFRTVIAAEDEDDIQSLSRTSTQSSLARQEDEDEAGADLDDDDDDEEDATETDTPTRAGTGDQIAKKQKKKRLARLRRKSIAVRAYEFTGADSDVSGILFMEISKITDLPPERNGRPYCVYIVLAKCKLTIHSDQDGLRYGSFRGDFPWEEGPANKMHSTQPESSIQRKDGVPGHEARNELLIELQCY